MSIDWIEQNQIFLDLPIEKLLTILVFGEAGQEPLEGKLAVLNVVNNRVLFYNDFYDKDIYNYTNDIRKAVILKYKQFSMFNFDDPVREKAIKWINNFESLVINNSKFSETYKLVLDFLDGKYSDNIQNAVYYHTLSINPYWSKFYQIVGQIGNHIFYTDNKYIKTVVKYSPYFTGFVITGIIIYLVLKDYGYKRD